MSDDSSIESLNEHEIYMNGLAKEIEEKVAVLGEIHPDLGPLLVKYADALLIHEEDNLDPFAGEEAVAEDETTDLQIAWECFEQARLCYEASQSANDKPLSFIHQRLGDLCSLQSAFDTAIEAYSKALALSQSHRAKAGILMSLGQAQLLSKKIDQAKETYQVAKDELGKWKQGLLGGTQTADEFEVIDASLAAVDENLLECNQTEVKPVVEVKPGDETGFDKPSLQSAPHEVKTVVARRKLQEIQEEEKERKKVRKD